MPSKPVSSKEVDMHITRFDPGTDLFRNLFEELWPRSDMSALRVFEADVVEFEDEIRVVAEIPGVGMEDLELTLEANVLTISGEKRQQDEELERRGRFHLDERRWGRFSRSFVLPREVRQDQVTASFDNGVLTVRIPKSETARRRRIEISAGDGSQQLTSGDS
jgi:HSP20 family protein